MIRIDRDYLVELGLAALPNDVSTEFIAHIHDTLETRVKLALSGLLLTDFEPYYADVVRLNLRGGTVDARWTLLLMLHGLLQEPEYMGIYRDLPVIPDELGWWGEVAPWIPARDSF